MAQAATRVVRRIPSAALFTTGKYRKPQQVVAAYARVSTEKEEQEDSFERQVQHYTSLITSKSDWIFGGIYADPGITGTRAEKRPDFMRMIQDCRDGKINKPLSDKTILEHHRLISMILEMAVKEQLVPYNAAARATPPKVSKKEADYFQPEEVADIVKALEDVPIKWKAMSYILIDTGCRRGELMGLQWHYVDLDKGIMMIKQALLYTKDKGVYVGPPKTGRPRAVCLAPETIDVLKKWKTEQLRTKIRHADILKDTGFIFTKDDGSAMHPDSITDWLNKFSETNDLPHIHPHAFRHTVASILIASGIDSVTTTNELGHADANTTNAIYAHQIARARAEASGVRAGVFSVLREA